MSSVQPPVPSTLLQLDPAASKRLDEASSLARDRLPPTAFKVTKSAERKTKHRARPSSRVPLICEICHRQFTTNSNLRRHAKLYRDKLAVLINQFGEQKGCTIAQEEHVNSNPNGPKAKPKSTSTRWLSAAGKDVQQRHQEMENEISEEDDDESEDGDRDDISTQRDGNDKHGTYELVPFSSFGDGKRVHASGVTASASGGSSSSSGEESDGQL
ncbi:hypothetical protein ACM66B_001365 [Microbotryomycetes sp. NB124-2]